MASRSHLGLRLAALALLAAVAMWPREHARSRTHAERAHELVRTSMPHTLETAARGLARPVATPASAPDEVADADEAALTN